MEGKGKGFADSNSFKESLSVYLDLNEGDRKDYQAVKNALFNAFQPAEARFLSLQEYECRKMHPGESPQEFLYAIKRLLSKAIPEMDEGAREQLLLHRFLSGIPEHFSRSIRASTDVRNVQEALERVKLLALCQPTEKIAAISDILMK